MSSQDTRQAHTAASPQILRGGWMAAHGSPALVAAPDLRVIAELPARRAKRVGDRHVHILVAGVTGDRDVVAGHREIDPDVKHRAEARVLVGLIDDDRAPLDARMRVLQPGCPVLDRDLGGGTDGHPMELDLEREWHA
jgi:hypothetical protein